MRQKAVLPIVLLLLAVYLVLASFTYPSAQETSAQNEKEDELTQDVDDILDELDMSEFEAYLATLGQEERALFGFSSIKDAVRAALDGSGTANYGSFASYLFKTLGKQVSACLPILLAVVSIALLYNILASLQGKFAADSVRNIVYFACVSLMIAVLFTGILGLLENVRSVIESLQTQMRVALPLLLTLMTAIGASASVGVYRPSVAVLAGGICELVTAFVLPAFLASIVLTAVGHLSHDKRLGKLSDFFSSGAKWLLGTAFFLFSAFLAVQGITASVHDGVSVRTAKFALSKYVPIIGGYLSDGLNLVMAGSVLLKNAVGSVSVVLLFLSVAPVLIRILAFGLGLKFVGALIEPLDDGRMSGLVSGLGKALGLLISVVLAVAFLYFLFLILMLTTGNIAL